MHLSSPQTCYMLRPSHSFRLYQPNNIWWKLQIIQLLIMYFSVPPCSIVPLRPKYSPQHPIFKSSQCTFFSKYERPCFPTIQNNRQLYFEVLHSILMYQIPLWLHQLNKQYLLIRYIYYVYPSCFAVPHTIIREKSRAPYLTHLLLRNYH